MVISKDNMTKEIRENMRGGGGSVEIYHALPQGELPPHFRLLSPLELKKGCGIGSHTHTGETEAFYVVQGEGIFDDDGTEKVIKKGDLTFTGGGKAHAVRNEKEEPLVLLAAIITEQ